MNKIYKYIYIVMYRWNLRKIGEADDPGFNALLGISFIAFLGLLDAVILINLFANGHLVPNYLKLKIPGAIVLIVLFVVNYFVFYRNKNYKNIDEEFSSMPQQSRKRWSGLTVLIVIVLFGLLILLPVIQSGG